MAKVVVTCSCGNEKLNWIRASEQLRPFVDGPVTIVAARCAACNKVLRFEDIVQSRADLLTVEGRGI